MNDDTLQVGSKVAVFSGFERTPQQRTITRETATQWLVPGVYINKATEVRFHKRTLYEARECELWAKYRIEPWSEQHQDLADRSDLLDAIKRAQHRIDTASIAAVRKLREAVREFIEGEKQ